MIQVVLPFRAGITIWRWDLHSEVGPPFGGGTSILGLELSLEVGPPVRGGMGESDIGSQVEINTCNDV